MNSAATRHLLRDLEATRDETLRYFALSRTDLARTNGPGKWSIRYLLHHRHDPQECGVVFASFRGHQSSLRHRPTLSSCRSGGHAIWWAVEAATEEDALRLLPPYVAQRTDVTTVSEVDIP